MKCESCCFVDHSTIYASNPPVYKCEKHGCIVSVTDKCKGDNNAEEQKEK